MEPAGLVGEVLDGRYRVEAILGEGGMGVVLAAEHIVLQQSVAIKLMRADADPSWRRRFMQEARAAARIEDEHVARVIDVGRLSDGTPFMAMERLEGRDLAQVVADDGPLSVDDAIEYALQVCQALTAAHALGIVHRDVKPANLFLTHKPDGSACIKLLDFGISKQRSEVGTLVGSLTGTNTVLGSPQFMSPEQLVSSRSVDGRADLWSLGATIFELMALEHVFAGDSLAELCTAILRDPPRSLRDYRPDAPAALEEALLGCLVKDRAKRIPTPAAFARLLEPLAGVYDEPAPESTRCPSSAPPASFTLVMASDEEEELPDSELTPGAAVRLVAPVVRPRPRRWPVALVFAGLALVALTQSTGPAPALFAGQPMLAPADTARIPLEPPSPPPVAAVAPSSAPAEPPPVIAGVGLPKFNDSVRLPEAQRGQIEEHLRNADEALADDRFDAAADGARWVLRRLLGLGIRPHEGVSSLGAHASLLLGRAAAAALEQHLDPFANRTEAEQRMPQIDRGLQRARAAYDHVRVWGIPSLYRCALAEMAAVDLATGRVFVDALATAESRDDRAWLHKSASTSLRLAQLGFRSALYVPAETTLCFDEAKRGQAEAKRVLKALPRVPGDT